ncbi:hypothetical protein GCM10023093_04670 [Nemorincola caseinilytica]|uniref:Lipoprotein n=1 Tax=Nemorincola caseinilytica TaxID=2054315 RepID=A0ABP8N6R6_9BACT
MSIGKGVIKVLLGLACITLASCIDRGLIYTYRIHNNADTTISVHVKEGSTIDTTFITPGEQKVVHTHGYLVGKNARYTHHDVSRDMKYMFVIKRGDTSKRNYLDNNSWSFDANTGTYSATVTATEF